MSIGQPCKYCMHGKMRPMYFSWDEAVVLCDNKKCESLLYVLPCECIVKVDYLHKAHHPLKETDLKPLLNDGSGGSSSGVFSEARSSLPSPVLSRKSGTDEEVELLLRESYSPLSFKDITNHSAEPSQVPPRVHNSHSDDSRYDGFFELLGSLDLELPAPPVSTASHSESAAVENGLDVVTRELEGWMEHFEAPSLGTGDSNIFSDGCQQPPSNEVLKAVSVPEEAKIESGATTTKLQAPCIPSHRSAFSPVDAANEEPASFISNKQNFLVSSFSNQSSSAEKDAASECVIPQFENSCFSIPFMNECLGEDTTFATHFMSPTTSASSEDSGYNEEYGKTSSSEFATGEANFKLSSKAFVYSSLKNAETTKSISDKPSHQSNVEKLIQNSMDWQGMSDVHTLTVLPAMVTTENNFTESSQESPRLPSITQTSSGTEVCAAAQDERERIGLTSEQTDGGPQIPSEICEDYEHETALSENHDHTLRDEGSVVSASEPREEPPDAPVIPQPSGCIQKEGSSHSISSEPSTSENSGNGALSVDTSSGEDKNKRVPRKRRKFERHRSLGNSARKCALSDESTVPAASASRTGEGVCGEGRGKGQAVKRRKRKIPGFRCNKRRKHNVPSKSRPSNKLRNLKKKRRLGTALKVLGHSARRRASSWDGCLPASSEKNDAGEDYESDDEGDVAASQNSSWQVPERRTSQLSGRVNTVSPRKLLVGHVNKDPWSVADLCLEELAIEIIVQDQREGSRRGDNAADPDEQLRQVLSLFGKQQSESVVPHSSPPDTAPASLGDVCGEVLRGSTELAVSARTSGSCDGEEGKIDKSSDESKSVEGEDNEEDEPNFFDVKKNAKDGDGSMSFDAEDVRNFPDEERIGKDSDMNMSIDNEEIVQNFTDVKNLELKEHEDLEKVKLKDVATNIFHKLPTELSSSQLDGISKSQSLMETGEEDSQPPQKADPDSDSLLAAQRDTTSDADEGSSLTTLQTFSNNFSNEDEAFKEQLVSHTSKGIYALTLEDNTIISKSQEKPLLAKLPLDTPQKEAISNLAMAESIDLETEKCVIEKTSDQKFMENAFAFQSINFGRLKTLAHESPWFEKACDGNQPSEMEEVMKNQSVHQVTNISEEIGKIEACSTDSHPSIVPETIPHYFLNPPKFGPVRGWIECKDDVSLTDELHCEEETGNGSPSQHCPGGNSEHSPSKYFESLLKDRDFDESFLQCAIHEDPSETFSEHLESSLFFGETASDSLGNTEKFEVTEPDVTCEESSKSNGASKSFVRVHNQHQGGSVTPAASVHVPRVPLPSTIAQVPITSAPINTLSCKASSSIGQNNVRTKTIIIPGNSKVRYVVRLPPSGVKSLDKSALSPSKPKLPLKSLVLQASTSGSQEVSVRSTAPELPLELMNYYSEWDTDTIKNPVERVNYCAESTGTSNVLGVVTNQGSVSNMKHVKVEGNGREVSALSDPSPQDVLDKESGLDVMLESQACIGNCTEIPSSSGSFLQTSSCQCSGKSENCQACNGKSEGLEDKADVTTPCKEDADAESDSSSDSDGETDDLPLMFFDSDDEVLVTQPGSVHEGACTSSQKASECCIDSDKNYMTETYLVDDFSVGQCSVSDCDKSVKTSLDLNEMKEPEASFKKTLNLGGLKRKVDGEKEGNKKQRLHDESVEVMDENQPSAFSSSRCSLLMCGILDNSIPHTEQCCSLMHQDFEDFSVHRMSKENTHHKTYTTSSKRHKSKDGNESTADNANNILTSCVAETSADNDYSACSNAKETTTHAVRAARVFNRDIKFGSVKASPQYDSYSCLRIEKETDDLGFIQLDSLNSDFLASLISPTESPDSTPKPSQEERDSDQCTSSRCDDGVEVKEEESVVTEAPQQKELLPKEEITASTSECTPLTSTADDLDKRTTASPRVSYTPNTDVFSRNAGMSKGRKTLIITKLGSNIDHRKPHGTLDADKLNRTLSKMLVIKSAQSSPSSSSVHSGKPTKTLYISRPLSLPPGNACASTKTNTDTGEVYLGSQYVTGATTPQSCRTLPPLLGSLKTALSPLVVTPSLAPTATTGSQMTSADVQTQSPLDYQMPLPANAQTVIPPALVTSYGSLSSTLPQKAKTVSTISASTKGPLKTIITLSGNPTHYPVTRLVRALASSSLSPDCLNANKIKVHEEKERNSESASDSSNTQGSSSMLKKVMLGSNGSFYLRPAPALKNAISEMRKKESTEDKEDEETGSGYLTLPDGNPIPHPIFIPTKKSEVQFIKKNELQAMRRKRKRRKVHNRAITKLLEDRLKQSLECDNKKEIPKMMVVYASGSFHICQIDVAEDR